MLRTIKLWLVRRRCARVGLPINEYTDAEVWGAVERLDVPLSVPPRIYCIVLTGELSIARTWDRLHDALRGEYA
jgi:hypothetical protein